MGYQVLARGWHPRDFTTLVGQEYVVKTPMHALEQQCSHHAYLFMGMRDVDETTLSRILAKSLSCASADGQDDISTQPYGVCRTCIEIDARRFTSYIETDAASSHGVDGMAQLLGRTIYVSISGRFRVYMIDKVHMLTSHVFNAMLKTLGEPPEHVKFVLATTDPQKVSAMVLPCRLQSNLKQMSPGHIISHLDRILGEEGIAHELNMLRLLAAMAQGSIRDVLSLANQATAHSAGEVSEAAIRGMLGAVDQNYLVHLFGALIDENGAAFVETANKMAKYNLSFSDALQDLASLLQKIASAQVVLATVQDDWSEADDMRRLAERFDVQSVQLFHQFTNLGRNRLAFALDEYAGFTMTVLRILMFQSGYSSGGAMSSPGGNGDKRVIPLATSSAILTRPTVTAMAPMAAPTARVAPVVICPEPVIETPRAANQAVPPASAPVAVVSSMQTTAPTRRLPIVETSAATRQASDHGRGGTSAFAVTPVATPVARPAAPVTGPRPNTTAATATMVSPPQCGKQSAAVVIPAGDGPPPWDEMPGEFASPSLEKVDTALAGRDAALGVRPSASESATGSALIEIPAVTPAPVKMIAPEPVTAITPLDLNTNGLAASDDNWPALIASLSIRGLTRQLTYRSRLAAMGSVTIRLRVPLPPLVDANVVGRLETVPMEYFGIPVHVAYDIGSARATMTVVDAGQYTEHQRDVEDAIATNLLMWALVRDSATQIVPRSIRPHAH